MAKFFDDSLFRQFEEIERMSRPLRDLQQQLAEEFAEKIRPSIELQRLTEQLAEATKAAHFPDESFSRRFEEITRTEPLREQQQLAEEFAGRTKVAEGIGRLHLQDDSISRALETLGRPEHILHEKLADSFALGFADLKSPTLEKFGSSLSAELRTLDLKITSQQIDEMLASSQVDYRTLGISSPLKHYVETLSDIQLHIANSYSHDLFNSFTKSIRESISPSLAALQEGVIGPAAGLMTADPFRRHGILSWKWPSDRVPSFGSAVLFAAPLSPKQNPPSSQELFIECLVSCSICGDRMIMENEEWRWDSPRRLTGSIKVVPICSACTREANESPDYWTKHLAHLMEMPRPSLRLIRGGGKGEKLSKTRDHLRLIKPEKDDD